MPLFSHKTVKLSFINYLIFFKLCNELWDHFTGFEQLNDNYVMVRIWGVFLRIWWLKWMQKFHPTRNMNAPWAHCLFTCYFTLLQISIRCVSLRVEKVINDFCHYLRKSMTNDNQQRITCEQNRCDSSVGYLISLGTHTLRVRVSGKSNLTIFNYNKKP